MTDIFIRKYVSPFVFGSFIIQYFIANLQNLGITYDIGVTPNPLPQTSADDAIVIKITGNLLTIKISWVLKDQLDDQATNPSYPVQGPATYDSKTVGQQLAVFDQVMQSKGIDDKYQFIINYDDVPYSKDGILSDITLNTTGDTPNAFIAECTFVVGNVVTIAGLDVPNEPDNLVATVISDTEVDLTWDLPSDPGGSVITGIFVERRTGLGSFAPLASLAFNAVSYNDTTCVTDTTYTYRVYAANSQGHGQFSEEKQVTTT